MMLRRCHPRKGVGEACRLPLVSLLASALAQRCSSPRRAERRLVAEVDSGSNHATLHPHPGSKSDGPEPKSTPCWPNSAIFRLKSAKFGRIRASPRSLRPRSFKFVMESMLRPKWLPNDLACRPKRWRIHRGCPRAKSTWILVCAMRNGVRLPPNCARWLRVRHEAGRVMKNRGLPPPHRLPGPFAEPPPTPPDAAIASGPTI